MPTPSLLSFIEVGLFSFPDLAFYRREVLHMPNRPLRPCRHYGCPELTNDKSGYCEEHRRDNGDYDRYRGSPTERGYNYRWEKARVRFLKEHPLCVDCLKEGIYTPATQVDHIIPHRGDPLLFWDEENWQPLCAHHHSKKTKRGE